MTLKRKTPLRRKTRIKPRSAKTAKVYREQRAPLVRQILSDRPMCEAGPRIQDPSHVCHGASQDVHERKPRGRGGSITDPSNLLAVCRACHRWIHDHPKEAREQNLLAHSWE